MSNFVTARILPTFANEPSLRGELVRLNLSELKSDGETKALLLGNSHYIKAKTDGYVVLTPEEIEITCTQCGMSNGDHSRYCTN